MRCREVRARLSEFLDHELERPVRAEVASHLEDCDECVARLTTLSEYSGLLQSIPRPVPPLDLAAATLVALDREVEPPMTIVTRKHFRIPPHYFGSPLNVIRQVALEYEFKLVSYGFGVGLSFLMFGVMLAAMRPLVSLEPFVPSSERQIWVSAAEGQALGGPSTKAGHSLARVPEESSQTNYASAAHLFESEELVVLAEVSVDGRASIVEVLSGPNDLTAVNDLAAALNRPRSFIPARGASGRPVVSRVVLFLGHIDVTG